MPLCKSVALTISSLALIACAAPVAENDPTQDLGLLWVKHAAEYQAITAQVYATAIRDLPGFVNDTSWSAMPGYEGESNLPPTIIFDVDETVVSNVDFQLTHERPFANHKLDTWSSNTISTPVRGVREFIDAARDLGVTFFFVTGRPCQSKDGIDDSCPQQHTTVDDIRELGIDVDAEHVMLSDERPEWDREKLVRREWIAKNHRVIMLFGDDLSDFVPCARKKVVGPCATPATAQSRIEAVQKYGNLWGRGWYILPNPMHGSWTSVR